MEMNMATTMFDVAPVHPVRKTGFAKMIKRVMNTILRTVTDQRDYGMAHTAGHKTLLMDLPMFARGAMLRSTEFGRR